MLGNELFSPWVLEVFKGADDRKNVASNENWGMGFDINGTYMDEISNEENSYFECARANLCNERPLNLSIFKIIF